jgi:tetratricopeptide (TPR) repeat protein
VITRETHGVVESSRSGSSRNSQAYNPDMDTTVVGDTVPATPADQPLGPGTTIARYRIERRIGAGGMGVVFVAFDPELERNVALKLLRDCRDDADRLRREARALAALSHPNVVAVHDVGEHGGQLFLAMEYVDGGSFRDWIAKPRPWREVVRAIVSAGRGIEAAHAAGLVHRDIKPDNLLVSRDGRVCVTDFGIVASANRTRPDDVQLTVPGAMIGTPAYMPPEQLTGNADARSDQFSLCATAFEALFGTRPFAGSTVEAIVAAIVEGEIVETRRDVPRWLRAAIVRGLAPEPAQRWPSVGALCDELERRQHRPRRWLIAGGIATAALAGSAAAWLARPASTPSLPPCDAKVPEATWSTARAGKLAPIIGAGRVERIADWLRRWSNAAEEVCVSEPREPSLAASRRKCLDGQLAILGFQAGRWEHGDDTQNLLADISIMFLPLPWRCSRDVLADAPEPPTPVQAALGETARRVQVIHQANQFRSRDRDNRGIHDIAQQARDIQYPPLTTEVLLALANEQLMYRHEQEAAALALEVMEIARAGHEVVAELDATVALVGALRQRDPQQAIASAESARAIIRHIGGAPDVDAKLDGFVASAWELLDRRVDAAEAYHHAFTSCRDAYGLDSFCEWSLTLASLPTLEATGTSKEELAVMRAKVGQPLGLNFRLDDGDPAKNAQSVARLRDLIAMRGPDSLDESNADMTVATMDMLADQNELALENYEKAIAIRDALAVRDSKLAFALTQSAWIQLQRERITDALALAKRAVAVARASYAEEELAGALAVLGRVRIATGTPNDAVPLLRESLALADKLQVDGRRRARTRFALAQALWAGKPTDRQAARDLARAARVDFRAFLDHPPATPPNVLKDWEGQLAEIDRWLHDHQ